VTFGQSIFENPSTSRQGCQVSQPTLVTLALKPYQLTSVSWMSDIEQRVGQYLGESAGSGGELMCSHVMKLQLSPSSLMFDVVYNRILCEPVPPDSRLANFAVCVKGGILAGMAHSVVCLTPYWFCTHSWISCLHLQCIDGQLHILCM